MTDILSPKGMEPYFREKVVLHIYPSLDSTNNTAKSMSNPAHGTVVMADYQTAGRGRHERSFFSPPGCGIYMSIILRPEMFWLDDLALFTPMAAVAVCEAIEATTQKSPQIKWVNDVFLNGKKICGILTEAVVSTDGEDNSTSSAVSHIVVGIGINFIVPSGGFPPEISQTAGALFDPLFDRYQHNDNAHFAIPSLRVQLAAEVINRMLSPKNSTNKILAEYKKRLLVLQRRVLVINPDSTYEATALDINAQCGLIVQKDNGEILTLTAGEISLR